MSSRLSGCGRGKSRISGIFADHFGVKAAGRFDRDSRSAPHPALNEASPGAPRNARARRATAVDHQALQARQQVDASLAAISKVNERTARGVTRVSEIAAQVDDDVEAALGTLERSIGMARLLGEVRRHIAAVQGEAEVAVAGVEPGSEPPCAEAPPRRVPARA